MLKLIHKIAACEHQVRKAQILAPRVTEGRIRARVSGLVCELTPQPRNFEGWGVFTAIDLKTARLDREASLSEVSRYLTLLKSVRLILIQPLRGRSWLAMPCNQSEAKQKLGQVGPVVVLLVTEGRAFEQIVARYDGSHLWFERVDRSADATWPAFAASALRAFTPPDELQKTGLTPEFRQAYAMVFSPNREDPEVRRVRCSESRLRRALEMGGGVLRSFTDNGDFWTTHWSTQDGENHTTAVMKTDLTVLSAGICLSGEDQKFDLQSLVGVVEQRDREW